MSKPVAIIMSILLLCAMAGGSLVRAETIFTGALNSDVGVPGNWSSGLPTAVNPAIVGNGSEATYSGADAFDGLKFALTGTGQVSGGSVDINSANIVLFDKAVWTSGDEGLALGVGAGSGARFTTSGNSTVNLTNLVMGGGNYSWFRQYGGTVNISGNLTIGEDGKKGVSSRYALAFGNLFYEGQLSIKESGRLDFPDHSTGSVNLINRLTSVDDAKALIKAGLITHGGGTSPVSEFSVKAVDIEGEIYTEVRLGTSGVIPEPSSVVLLLAFFGIVLVGTRLRHIRAR